MASESEFMSEHVDAIIKLDLRKFVLGLITPYAIAAGAVLSLLSGVIGWSAGSYFQAQAYQRSIENVSASAEQIADARGRAEKLLSVLDDENIDVDTVSGRIEKIKQLEKEFIEYEEFLESAKNEAPLRASIARIEASLSSYAKFGSQVTLCRDSIGCLYENNGRGADELDVVISTKQPWRLEAAE